MVESNSTSIHSPYQDDFDTEDTAADPIMQEENDDPIETFGIPPEEFRAELDDIAIDDDTDSDKDDMRETIEDRDEEVR